MRINLYTQQSVSTLAASAAAQSTTVLSTARSAGQTAQQATVNLSIDAITRSQAANLYNRYFPVREGFSADALGLGTALPQATSSSTGLSGDAIGVDARKRMDAVYAAMEASGNPFSYDSYEGQDTNTLFGSLDRRSLSAVANNQGGLFSSQEQMLAKSVMDQQQSLASGLYSGPIRLESTFKSVTDSNVSQVLAASFLDNVSDEEKATPSWQLARALVLPAAPTYTQDTVADALAKVLVATGLGSR